MTKLHHVYCDYDGVLVDFSKGIHELSGRIITQDTFKEVRHLLTVDFWANLEPMPDWLDLWNHLSPYEPFILTAYPKNPGADVIAHTGKRIWNDKYTKVPAHRMHVVPRQSKQHFAMGNILIDDHMENIDEWTAAGGIGIYHTSAAETIEQLKKLGYDGRD